MNTNSRSRRPSIKSSRKNRNSNPIPDVAEVCTNVAAAAVEVQSSTLPTPRVKKSRNTKLKSPNNPVTEPLPPVPEESEPVSSRPNERVRKQLLTKDALEQQFSQFQNILENEIKLSREDKQRKVGVRLFRDLLRDLKKLKTSSLKAMKIPKKRTNTSESGFMKPVPVSKEIAQFAGWSENDLKSRVDVTNYLCEYIRTNNLQNPNDRRQIIPDENLRRILNFDKDKSTVSYPEMQGHIQHHFQKSN